MWDHLMRASNLLTSVILAGTVVASCSGCQNEAGPDALAAQSKQNDVVTVKVVRPERKTIKRTTTQPATVHAYHQAKLYAKVAGYLEELNVDIGSEVDADDVLGTIAVPEMQKARERQRATIARLRADEKRYDAAKKLAEANVEAAKAMRDQAAADVKKTVAQLNADEAAFTRVKELVANKAVAGRLRDEAQKKFEASQAARTAAEAARESAKANVSVAEQKVAVADADALAAQEATKVAGKQLEEMDVLMAYATLKAPFKGVVTGRHVDRGDLVRNTQTASDSSRKPLFIVAQIDKVRVRSAVPENDAPWANKDDPVTLQLRSLRGRTFDRKISRVARSLDESTRTMLVEFDLPNVDGELLPGMYGEATITLEEKANALMLPAGALRYDEHGRAFVYVVQANGTIQIVDVETGADDGTQIEITSGLDETARVVDSMIGRLAAGQRVKIQE